MYVGHHYAHTHTQLTYIRHAPSNKQHGKTGTTHRLCEIDVNIINGMISFTHHEQYYIDIQVQI
jgi:hypothetical protein